MGSALTWRKIKMDWGSMLITAPQSYAPTHSLASVQYTLSLFQVCPGTTMVSHTSAMLGGILQEKVELWHWLSEVGTVFKHTYCQAYTLKHTHTHHTHTDTHTHTHHTHRHTHTHTTHTHTHTHTHFTALSWYVAFPYWKNGHSTPCCTDKQASSDIEIDCYKPEHINICTVTVPTQSIMHITV